MSRVITVLNGKGGVGKTTSVIQIAYELASEKEKVLIIDLDPQGDATRMITGHGEHPKGLFDLLVDEKGKLQPLEFIQPGTDHWPDVFVVPADERLNEAEQFLSKRVARDSILKRIVAQYRPHFSTILLDMPPVVNNLTVNALTASDAYLIPTDLSDFSRERIPIITELAELIRSNNNPSLEFLGVVVTSYQKHGTKAVSALIEELEAQYKEKLLPVRIPDSVKVIESQKVKMPAGGNVAAAYRSLTKYLGAQS